MHCILLRRQLGVERCTGRPNEAVDKKFDAETPYIKELQSTIWWSIHLRGGLRNPMRSQLKQSKVQQSNYDGDDYLDSNRSRRNP
jgi:hypothetical protein